MNNVIFCDAKHAIKTKGFACANPFYIDVSSFVVVGREGIEPPTRGFSVLFNIVIYKQNIGLFCRYGTILGQLVKLIGD